MLITFFLNGLRDTYGAEKELTKALPELQDAATSPDLKAAFEEHLKVTENQIQRLERVFSVKGSVTSLQ
jgi:ferritin-like metal-binding protein YciE